MKMIEVMAGDESPERWGSGKGVPVPSITNCVFVAGADWAKDAEYQANRKSSPSAGT
jgi:hypothetical protein